MVVQSTQLFRSILAATALLVAGSNSALAEELPGALVEREKAVKLLPSSPWNIDFADNKCRLSRLFGSDADRHLLVFEQAAPGSSFGMTLAGPRLEPFKKSQQLEIGMKSEVPMDETQWHRPGDVTGFGPAIIFANRSIQEQDSQQEASAEQVQSAGIDLDEANAVERIVLRRGPHVLSFETGAMMPPFQALNVCTADLLRVWGLDAEAHRAFFPAKWLNERRIAKRISEDYPPTALRAGQAAIFRVRLIVEIDGSVSDCHMEQSTIADRLDTRACRALLRAKFEPATTSEGEPIRSFYATTITYSVG